MNESTEIFEAHRAGLFSLAYGMLKRVAPAEDAVQEAFLRWQKQDIGQIHSPQNYLYKIVNNICLDEIKSARNRREKYIGPDLPEPFVTTEHETPETEVELAESLSMALFVVLDQLNPVERAVFILREVFDYDYGAISEIVDKSQSHCRKIAQRARQNVREKKPRFEKKSTEQRELVTAFITAFREGELDKIENKLAKEAILYADGGGKVTAAGKPVVGAAKIVKFLTNIRKDIKETVRFDVTDINGEPGAIGYLDNQLNDVLSFHIENGQIQSIFVILNPEKLHHLKDKL